MVPQQYYNVSLLRVCVDHAYLCHVMYTSHRTTYMESTRLVEAHAWKYMHGRYTRETTNACTHM